LGRRRPRPVADVPALDGREVARAWLVELVASAPLDRAATLPGPAFAANAPRLCAAVLAALASDAALDDLEPGGPLAATAADAAALAGAADAAEAVTALDTLRSVVWTSLVEALHRPPPALLADLADRLGATIATVTAVTLEASGASPAGPDAGRAWPAADPATGGASPAATTDPGRAWPAAARAAPPWPQDAAGPPHSTAATARRSSDADAATPPHPTAATARRPGDPAAPPPAPTGTARRSSDADAAPTPAPVVEDGGGFHARVAPWTAAVERRLERYARDGLPFAVMCLEVADLDRLVAAERDGDVALALEAAEAAVAAQLRPADVLVRERPGRYWLVAPDTDGDAARSLAHLLAAAVAGVRGHRGVPLETAVGVASCPGDGHDAATLEGRAEEGLFAARAAGLRVTGSPRG
jgi:GGDEF domain-containing protein